MDKEAGSFIWNELKELENIRKHHVDFFTAVEVFRDPNKRIFVDEKHTRMEERFFCLGKVGNKILTVRFTYRHGKIRIFGAGYWRKGEKYYEKKKGQF